MRAHVNQDVCIGCSLCASMVSDVFQMNDEGKAEAYQLSEAENQDRVQEAIDSCPVEAIEWA